MLEQYIKVIPRSVLVVGLILSCCQDNSLVIAEFFMEGVRFHVRTMTSDLFESDVMETKSAWILAIKGSKVSDDQWQTEENQLRGVVDVAFVDLITDGEFMFKKGIIKKDEPTPVAVVFPYGGVTTKKIKYKMVDNVKDAKRLALSSLSENFVTWINTKQSVENFVRDAYKSWPPRFPVVLTTERKRTPPLYRAISIKYSKYFNFGVCHSSNAHDILGLIQGAKIPRMDILISNLTPNQTLTMNGLTYTEAYGPVKYPYLIRFLFSAHDKHWPELPGSDRYTEEMDYEEVYKEDLNRIFANPVLEKYKASEEIKLADILEITYENHKKICNDSTPGFCVVAFLDGSSKVFETSYQVLSEVHKIKYFQEKPLKFTWINASCYPEYGATFGISLESLPAILVAKPQRRFYVMHSGKFTKDSIGGFLEKIFTGRLSLKPYSRFDDLVQRSCGQEKYNNLKSGSYEKTNYTLRLSCTIVILEYVIKPPAHKITARLDSASIMRVPSEIEARGKRKWKTIKTKPKEKKSYKLMLTCVANI